MLSVLTAVWDFKQWNPEFYFFLMPVGFKIPILFDQMPKFENIQRPKKFELR